MTTPTFNLHILGWKAFEDLVSCVFRDILGQTLQTFAEGADGGRDAAFKGIWSPEANKATDYGTFCVQCKHTSKASKSLNNSVVNGELEKVARLAAEGLCDTYFLVTNYSLPANLAGELEKNFVDAGAKRALVYGSEWLDQTIAASPRLRRLVPRIYGLGDLTQIITHQAYAQARKVLDSIAPDLGCFVPTSAYRKSAHALQEHGFVLLIGEPASGKTMIANLMALSAADEWQLQTIMVSSPADFSKYWNPDDPGQFLWVDDAFGATQYDASRAGEWNLHLTKLKAAIKAGARVVFTSRDYIFAAAKRDLKVSSFELFDDSRVVIKVDDLTQAEREMILYNHLKSGSQPREFKSRVKPFLEAAAKVPKFLPEISRRFAHPKFTKKVSGDEAEVLNFFAEPVQVLLDVVDTLAASEKAALGLVFIAAGRLPIPLTVDANVATVLESLDVSVGEVKSALVSLDDSLLKRIDDASVSYWTFRHPTIRDAYATMVGRNPELIDIYLAGVTTKRMLAEVTCGETSIQGVKIIVPPTRFQVVAKRLDDYTWEDHSWQHPKLVFLNSRCSNDFLVMYLAGKNIDELISLSNMSPYDSGIGVIGKLNRAGLLDEGVRQQVAARIVQTCERDRTCKPLESSAFRALLTDTEYESAALNIGVDVLANGTQLIEDLKNEWDTESDPFDVFYEINRTLDFIESEDLFDEDQQAEAANLRELVEEAQRELQERYEGTPYQKLEAEEAVQATPTTNKSKSVFDDVDE
ncbi:hypothetical protein MW290_02335 [Aquincola tertiaricarbonis]|uniref:Restriction endonuclease type IV Mrr domain-containing protein n=1 Tax=Aquincola tertiaricarbonis TaxID=391953 RepID=A0ABY4S4W0_AQUTE|nr:hypothetical protein [Aquincola tertiaricarbonis]URI07479.1 hypothetical protein MW290_02335 [Aquincola tertiaricarbonis]